MNAEVVQAVLTQPVLLPLDDRPLGIIRYDDGWMLGKERVGGAAYWAEIEKSLRIM